MDGLVWLQEPRQWCSVSDRSTSTALWTDTAVSYIATARLWLYLWWNISHKWRNGCGFDNNKPRNWLLHRKATVASPAASVAGPSTPTPKRASRNTWASPKKPHGSTSNTTPSRQAPPSTASNIMTYEARDGSDDTLSGDAPPLAMRAPSSASAPAEDGSQDPDAATEVVLGMSVLFRISLRRANDIVWNTKCWSFSDLIIVPGNKRVASTGSDILPPRKIPQRAGGGAKKPRAWRGMEGVWCLFTWPVVTCAPDYIAWTRSCTLA